ncbi:MAG: glycosyltransferase family 39 protein [Alphaproteobacteria bacterium]|nr:glycosyltransferase family 39 protein [Alphaproteobacteria bacterium]
MTSRINQVMLGLALAFAAMVRLVGLGESSLWLDELFTVRVATVADQGLIDALRGDVHPPLYFALARLWAPIAGQSELLWRLPSALCGLVTVAATARLARRLGGQGAEVGAAWVIALLPLMVDLDREARGNALMVCLVACAAAAAVQPVSDRPWRRAAVVGTLCAGAVWTHFSGVFAVLGLIMWQMRAPERDLRVVAGAAAGLGSLVLWAPVLFEQTTSFAADPWYAPPPPDALAWLWPELWGGHLGPAVLVGVVLFLALLRMPAAVVPLLAAVLNVVVLPHILGSFGLPLLRPRNVLSLAPFVAAAAGVGVVQLRAPHARSLLFGLLLCAHFPVTLATQVEAPATEDWRGAAARVPAGAVVAAVHPQLWRFYRDDVAPLALDEVPDAAPALWVLLAHDLHPDGLDALLARGTVDLDEALPGARVLRLTPLVADLAAADFPDVEPAAEATADGLHFYGGSAMRSRTLELRGTTCRVGVAGRSDAALGEGGRVALRLSDGGAPVLDHHVEPGPELSWSPFVPVASGQGRLELAFVNDAADPVTGDDRNVHLTQVRVECADGAAG